MTSLPRPSADHPFIDHRFSVDVDRCIRCGACVNDCPVNILTIGSEPPRVADGREQDCIGCQHCLAICPTGAVSVLGRQAEQATVIAGGFPDRGQLALLMRGRRSVRCYRDEDVDRATISQLLAVAAYAPTGRNTRQTRFTVVADRAAMERIRQVVYACLAAALTDGRLPVRYEFFRQCVDGWHRYQADVIFRWSPHLLVATVGHEAVSPEQDAIIALSYFDLLAQNAGLGTLWNGMATIVLNLFPEVCRALALPDGDRIGFAMSFGKPAVTYQRTVWYPDPPINWVVAR